MFDIASSGLSNIQPERIVDRMGRLGEPARTGLGDDHVVLEANAELAIDADRRLVRECHAWPQHGLVALHEIRPLVDVEADAVSGAVRQARRRVARTEAA